METAFKLSRRALKTWICPKTTICKCGILMHGRLQILSQDCLSQYPSNNVNASPCTTIREIIYFFGRHKYLPRIPPLNKMYKRFKILAPEIKFPHGSMIA